jgi:hypothetical protein
MARLFICDRRTFTATFTGRISNQLVPRFGAENVVKDVGDLPAGVDFATATRDALRQCDVELVVIGRDWLERRTGDAARRLDDPADRVRIEIEMALSLGLTLIPVLIDGASMPASDDLPEPLQPLTLAPALPVRNGPEFSRDVERVSAAVDRAFAAHAATRLAERRAAELRAADLRAADLRAAEQHGVSAAPMPAEASAGRSVGGLSPVPPQRQTRRGLILKQRRLIGALAGGVVLVVCAALVFSGALRGGGGAAGTGANGSLSAAQATQTFAAGATQTVLAAPQLPYFAKAPGPKCDRGYGPWQSTVGGVSFHGTITCFADHTHVTGLKGCSTCGDGGFSYTVGAGLKLPEHYTVSVQASNVGVDTNVFLELSLGGYGDEVVEFDSPNAGSAYASLQVQGQVPVGSVTVAPASSHTLTMTVNGPSFTFALDGQVMGTRTEPQSLRVTIFDLVMQTKDSKGGGQVDFSNFSVR